MGSLLPHFIIIWFVTHDMEPNGWKTKSASNDLDALFVLVNLSQRLYGT
jgi:hypothetical protein